MFTRKAKREVLLTVMILLTAQLVYALFYSDTGYRQLQEKREELRRLQLEQRNLLEEQRKYVERIGKLKSDPAEIERIARERYNFAKPGDVIVNLPAEDAGRPTKPVSPNRNGENR